jgi:hypothetical protein|nr:MAG TPA: hypothetical protein [Caudoviricetes sp.]
MAKSKTFTIEPLKETTLKLELIGDTDLILHKRSRYYEQAECWKQAHDKGTKMPEIYNQSKNIWEGLITGIHWEKPIEFHDEDISLYTQEEWESYMKDNRPCILTQAFKKAFTETFITFFKDSTGKKGTDIKRSLSMAGSICPVTFSDVEVVSNIVPTSGISASPVLCSSNVFHNWRTIIEVSCPDIVFPHETVLQLIETSGKYIGIGTQRANGNGRYHINPENVTII